jgi:hypothetical protein
MEEYKKWGLEINLDKTHYMCIAFFNYLAKLLISIFPFKNGSKIFSVLRVYF